MKKTRMKLWPRAIILASCTILASLTPATAIFLPVSNTRITSDFGQRVHPVTGAVDFHSGVDLAAAYDQPVHAILDGQVTRAGPRGALGNAVEIFHRQRGVSTIYGHLNRVDVVVGQRVARGMSIGLAGSTGRSTGPHLHFTVRQQSTGRDIDPMTFVANLNLDSPIASSAVTNRPFAGSKRKGAPSVAQQAGYEQRSRQAAAKQLAAARQLAASKQAKLAALAAAKRKQQQEIAALKQSIEKTHRLVATNEVALRTAEQSLTTKLAEAKKYTYLFQQGAVSRNEADKSRKEALAGQSRVAQLKQGLAGLKQKLSANKSLLAKTSTTGSSMSS